MTPSRSTNRKDDLSRREGSVVKFRIGFPPTDKGPTASRWAEHLHLEQVGNRHSSKSHRFPLRIPACLDRTRQYKHLCDQWRRNAPWFSLIRKSARTNVFGGASDQHNSHPLP